MRRRAALQRSLVLLAGGFAGCISGGGGEAPTTPTETTEETSATSETTTELAETTATSPTASSTEDNGPSLVSRSFRLTDAGCGAGTDAATVSADGDEVTVAGTISGRDACRRARLATASYDAEADVLDVLVETYADGEACAQCLVDLDYEASFGFDGGPPATVVVRHRSLGETRTVSESSL